MDGLLHMHRHQLQNLHAWLRRPGRKPLVIRGVRQVAKSMLVELFCASAGRDPVAVNLERQADLAEASGKSSGSFPIIICKSKG